ncbi:hypothetical protein OAE39_02805 [Akkermansiaceae bacterium]|nr:hypothetical protein [Akkermansiaceae bacterium]
MKTTTDKESPSPGISVEAALQEAHSAMKPGQRRIWPWVVGCQVLVVVLGYVFMPYFSTHLIFDREAMAAEEALIAERARAYREQQEAERTDLGLREEHADPLKRQEREKRRQEVVAHVQELEDIARRIREERDAQLRGLTDISSDALSEGVETKLEESLRKFSEAASTVKANETISDRELFGQSANDLLKAAAEARQKANLPSGSKLQDRGLLSESLASTETTLEELRDANRDVWTGEVTEELDDAQKMANMLRALPRHITHARRQIQSFAPGVASSSTAVESDSCLIIACSVPSRTVRMSELRLHEPSLSNSDSGSRDPCNRCTIASCPHIGVHRGNIEGLVRIV